MNKAKQYYEALEQKTNELKSKYDKLRKEESTNPRVYFEEGFVKISSQDSQNKLFNFYKCLIKKVPEDKKEELNNFIKPHFYNGSSRDQSFLNRYGKLLKEGRYDFEFISFNNLREKTEIIEKIASYLTDKDIEEAIEENEQLVTANSKQKVKLFDKEITEAKQYVEANETDSEKKKEILKELDLLNETVVGANSEYRLQIDDFDKDFESGRNRINGKKLDEYIEKNNPESYNFLKREQNDYCLLNEKAIEKNPEEFKKHVDNIKLNLSEQNKESTIKILKAIEKMGIYNPIDNGSEQGSKVYGFRQIFDAHIAIEEALNNHDYSRLKELRENYTKAIENMKELFALTKKEFNPGPETMVGNLSNLRHPYVPIDFIDDIATNSTVSSLYNMYTIIKRVDCTPEEFVNDPAKYLTEYRELLKSTNLNIDEKSKGKSIAQALSHPMLCDYITDPNDIYSPYAIPRIIEGLQNRETDEKIKEELHYNAVYFNAFDSLYASYKCGYRDTKSYLANHYLQTKGPQTIANVLLVNDEDRIYSKLRAHEHYDAKDDLATKKPFDIKGYLTTHRIDPVELKNRIINTTRELYTIFEEKKKLFEEEHSKGNVKKDPDNMHEIFHDYMKGAKMSIQFYLLIGNPSLSHKGIADEPGIADLVNMLKDPTKMFGDLNDIKLDENTIEDIEEIKDKGFIEKVKTDTAKEFKKFVAEERKLESAFNKQAKKLFKNWQSDRDNKYHYLKKFEIDRLKNLYEQNKIPKDYYEQRTNLIGNDEFDKKVPIFDDGIMSKEDYIKSTGLEALTKEEMNGLYESYKLKLEHEKQIFIHSNYMVKNKHIPSPDNVSTEPLHGPEEVKKEQPKIEKISINLEEEKDLQPETKISDVGKEKSIEKDNEIDIK